MSELDDLWREDYRLLNQIKVELETVLKELNDEN